MSATRIEFFNFRAVSVGNVRGYLSLRLGGITIHDCKVVQQPGQAAWLAMPDRKWADRDGKARYSPYVEFSDSVKEMVRSAFADLDLHKLAG